VGAGSDRDHCDPVCFGKRRRQLRNIDGGPVRRCRGKAAINEADLHAVVRSNGVA